MLLRATLALVLLAACERPTPDRSELYGLWGRVLDGEYDILELAETIDATGLREVRPAYRRYRYPLTEVPLAMQGGRWVVVRDELIFNAAWSIDGTPTNRNQIWQILEFTPIDITLAIPDEEDEAVYTTISRLPSRAPSN